LPQQILNPKPELGTNRGKWATVLLMRLTDCLTHTIARCAFASLLGKQGQPDETLFHWNILLACDPASVTAGEDLVRFRQRIKQHLQSGCGKYFFGRSEWVSKQWTGMTVPGRSRSIQGVWTI